MIMTRIPLSLCIALSLTSALPQHRSVAQTYTPLLRPGPLSITDLVLIYQGGTHRPDWTVQQLLPYVSYADPQTKQKHWLFDGFLFIEFKDNRGFEFAHGYKQKPARKEEWLWLLERNFEHGVALEALDSACTLVASTIGPPVRKRKVVLTLPEPIAGQQDWGKLEAESLDFNKPEDRVAACTWYIEEALKRWGRLAPSNLDLAGFYWVAEYGSESATILPRIGEVVRSKGKEFVWIPYWKAPLAGEWKSLGFDVAYQQPNHFFHPDVSDERLNDACHFARSHGMGLEMEFDGRVTAAARDFQPRFGSYLEFFRKNAVIDSSAIAYYEGGGALLKIATSPQAEEKALYEALASTIISRQQRADTINVRRSY